MFIGYYLLTDNYIINYIVATSFLSYYIVTIFFNHCLINEVL